MMVANLYFYGYTALATLAIAFLWAALYVVHWKEIIPLQNCITALIGLSMIEMGTWYFDYVNFNVTGFRPYVTTLWAVFMGSLRKALSRMLVLVVSMGYGVVRPTLGGYTNQVLSCAAFGQLLAAWAPASHTAVMAD